MKTIKITLYSFNELAAEIQEKVLNNLANINVDSNWWEYYYQDAKEIGCKITGFDIDRGNYCELELINSSDEVANKIIKNHGESCDTYKLAAQFLADRDKLVEKYSDGVKLNIVEEGKEYDFDAELDELEQEFTKQLGEEYLILLRKEYEYLTSDEAIKETIEANEYTFEANGKMRNA